jgi:exopolyphosphatase/pppGpp-phosphohydrolase
MEEPFVLKFPPDAYTQEEQEHIMTLNKMRKELQSQKNHNTQNGYGMTKQKERRLQALIWVLRLIEEVE